VLRCLDRGGDGLDVMAVDPLHVPVRGAETRLEVFADRLADRAVVLDLVVVPDPGELAEAEMPGKRDRLVRDPLLQTAVADESVGAVVDELGAEQVVQIGLRNRHAGGVGDPLAEHAGGDLDPRLGLALGMPLADRADLPEGLDRLDRHPGIARQIEQGVEQHRAVAVREDETVAVEPGRVGRAEPEMPGEERGGDLRRPERGAPVSLAHTLAGIDGQDADRVRHPAWSTFDMSLLPASVHPSRVPKSPAREKFAEIGEAGSLLAAMRPHLPLSALRAFESAARTGSFRLAAAELGLTPSAVSHAIRGLESQLGAALFAREGRSIRLTPQGETLITHVERGLGELRLGISAVAARGPERLRLHCAPSFAAKWLVPRLKRLLAECRGLEVRIDAGADYTRFRGDEFDADIVYGAPRPEYYGTQAFQALVVLPLGTETVTPLCAPSLAAAIRSPQDLLGQTLIESAVKKVRWTDWFTANGLIAPRSNGPRFDRSFLSLAAAAEGLGVALESLRFAERELADGRLVRPLAGRAEDVTYVGHWLVFPRARRYAPALRLFVDWLGRELGVPLELTALDPPRRQG